MEEFAGYPAPTSNTTYTPNQFFDVVLPHSSRGVVRLVGYMIRRTLGWSDPDGNPQEPQVTVSYRQLVEEAGISRGAIQPAIEEAIDAGFIQRVQAGRPNRAGASSASALYELRWDESGEYIAEPAKFDGFFAGNGNLTYIPNAFFDYTLPNESLAVVRVVGAIIRNTIGFQTKYGFRRQHVEISFTELQQRTQIHSRTAFSKALQTAIKRGHLIRVKDGYFDPKAGKDSRSASYGLRWEDQTKSSEATEQIISKKPSRSAEKNHSEQNFTEQNTSTYSPKITEKDISGQNFPEQKFSDSDPKTTEQTISGSKSVPGNGSKSVPGTVQKVYRERFKKCTGERFKKCTGIKITENNTLNNIQQQQQEYLDPPKVSKGKTEEAPRDSAAAASVESASVDLLLEAGFDRETAAHLAAAHSPEKISRQISWLPSRRPTRNQLGMLRKSIEEDWPPPEPSQAPSSEDTPAEAFVRHCYAAWAGNPETPVAPVSERDRVQAEKLLRNLPAKSPSASEAAAWGRRFGEFIRTQEAANGRMPRSFQLALTRHGDAWLVAFRRELRAARKQDWAETRKAHAARYEEAYRQYLAEEQAQIATGHSEAWAEFEASEAYARNLQIRYCKSPEVRAEVLKMFDQEAARLERFQEFFAARPECRVLDFWQWDAQLNPNGLTRESQQS